MSLYMYFEFIYIYYEAYNLEAGLDWGRGREGIVGGA